MVLVKLKAISGLFQKLKSTKYEKDTIVLLSLDYPIGV